MLTKEKINALEAFLSEDEARAQKLGAMSAAEAAQAINAETGFDFTADELAEFAANDSAAGEELSEDALENVSGGSWKSWKSFWRGFLAGWRSC